MSEHNPFPEEPMPGFDRPQIPGDEHIADLYKKFELGEAPSLAEIEPVATALLDDPLTMMDGMGLVLGRRVDAAILAEDPQLGLYMLGGDAPKKFALLLLMKSFGPPERTNNT